MNTIALFKKKFDFLIEKQFTFKSFKKNSEIEIVFSKKDCKFEFFIDTYSENLDLIVYKGNQRFNITKFPFSDENKKYSIQQGMNSPGLEYKINLVSQFINSNLTEFF